MIYAPEGHDPRSEAHPVKRAELCEWFALCDRPATTYVQHPVLGAVPCCQRCAERATA